VALRRRPADPDGERLKRPDPTAVPPRESDWREQERRGAEALPGGKLQPGSGNGWRKSQKGDATSPLFLESSKTTDAASLSIKRDWLAEVTALALPDKRPVLLFGFDPDASGEREDWAAFRLSDARVLMRAAAALKSGDIAAAFAAAELL
jgi:hypothetical protein